MAWINGPLTGFDLETTGVDVEADRVVTSTIIAINPGKSEAVFNQLVNPGICIPEGAAKVHGITTEVAREQGEAAASAVLRIQDLLYVYWGADRPLIGHNLVYDLTLLDRELARHHGLNLEIRGPVLDTMVIDKETCKYRKGKGARTLSRVCEIYGVELTNAHSSEDDVRAAMGVLRAIVGKYPGIGKMDLGTLHRYQPVWYRNQQRNFADFLEKQSYINESGADRADTLRRVEVIRAQASDWPLRPRA